MLKSGATEINGKLPVNPSGGILAGNPYMVGGIARAAECYLQLTGKAGKHQVKGAKKALAHGTCGPAGGFHSVMIFGTD
jgi:acetyl-CoA C-acetyltransferase